MAKLIHILQLIGPVTAVAGNQNACVPCNPPNVKSLKPPSLGPDIADLYADLVESVQGRSYQIFEGMSLIRRQV